MAWDLGLRGETELCHRLGLILTPVVLHTWAQPGPRQVFFFSPFGSLTVGTLVSNLKPGRWDLGPGLVGTQDSVSKEVKVCD